MLRDRDFRSLFISTTVSQFGQQITVLALPLVAAVTLDGGESEVGALSAMITLAFLLIGLPAGAVDRMQRREVLISSDLIRAEVLLTVPVAWWFGILTIWQLQLPKLPKLSGGKLDRESLHTPEPDGCDCRYMEPEGERPSNR